MIHLPLSLAGRYRLDARKADGRLRPVADWFDNLILDVGMDELALSRTYLDCCQLGVGTSQPSAEQTVLESFTVATNNRVAANSNAAALPPYRAASQITWRFPVGAIVGGVSEIGVGSSDLAGSPLFSRARISDGNGDATSVEFLSDEAAEATYELGVTIPADDVPATLDYTDTSDAPQQVATVLRAANASDPAYWAPYEESAFGSPGQAVRAIFDVTGGSNAQLSDQPIAAITTAPGGTLHNYESATNESYSPGSFRRVSRVVWGSGSGNYGGGIASAIIACGRGSGGVALGRYQLGLTPKMVKNGDFRFVLDITHSWERA